MSWDSLLRIKGTGERIDEVQKTPELKAAYDDLMACGSMVTAKEKGLIRSEGKDYVFKDGDIVVIRFNV